MNKKNLVIIVLLSVVYLIYGNSLDYKSETKLPPLKSNETLEWEYDLESGILNIYKKNKKETTLYDSIDYLDWNNWEVSKDRKKIIYWESWSNYESNELPNYYLLDGNTGKTSYLGKIHEGYTSGDFKYLIYKDPMVEPKVKFILYNIETNKYDKEFLWSLKSEKYFSEEENATYIMRSNLPEYDYHIFIVGMGQYIFAEGYLSINQNKIITLVDDDEEDRLLDLNSFSKFEFGK